LYILVLNNRYSCIRYADITEEGEALRRNYILLTVVGLPTLVLGLWTFEDSLFNDRIEKVETYQISDVIGVKERRAYPLYAYPNEGVGSTQAGYGMHILVNYRNLNGTLKIEDY
jgi:hypothetical protein